MLFNTLWIVYCIVLKGDHSDIWIGQTLADFTVKVRQIPANVNTHVKTKTHADTHCYMLTMQIVNTICSRLKCIHKERLSPYSQTHPQRRDIPALSCSSAALYPSADALIHPSINPLPHSSYVHLFPSAFGPKSVHLQVHLSDWQTTYPSINEPINLSIQCFPLVLSTPKSHFSSH